ncbi:MAG: hypothetical protein ACOCTG_00045 [Bacteroidota bacterium]
MAVEASSGGLSRGAWLIIGLVILAVVVIAVLLIPRQMAVEQEAELHPSVERLGDWVAEEMPLYDDERLPEMAAEGFNLTADAIEELARPLEANGDSDNMAEPADTPLTLDERPPGAFLPDEWYVLSTQLDSVRANADSLGADDYGSSPAFLAAAAARSSASVLRLLQEHHYTGALVEAAGVTEAAAALDSDDPLAEQREALEHFFTQTYSAAHVMSVRRPVGPDPFRPEQVPQTPPEDYEAVPPPSDFEPPSEPAQ